MSEGGAGQGGCGGGEGAKRRQRSPARPSACIFGEKRTAWSGRGGGLRSSGAAAESVGRLSCVTELPNCAKGQAAGRKRARSSRR